MTTALIVTYESQGYIRECVASVLDAGIEEVVVWDNSPSPATREELARFCSAKLRVDFDGRNHGFGGGVNRAFGKATGDGPILLVNPDCIITREAVLSLEDAYARHGECIVAPRMIYPDGTAGIAGGPRPRLVKELAALTRADDLLPGRLRSFVLDAFRSRASGRGSYADSLSARDINEFDWVSGFCMLIGRTVFESIHGFDERYFLYFEDVDICERARQNGFHTYLDGRVAVLHDESASTRARGKSKHYVIGMARYFSLHGNRFERRVSRLFNGVRR